MCLEHAINTLINAIRMFILPKTLLVQMHANYARCKCFFFVHSVIQFCVSRLIWVPSVCSLQFDGINNKQQRHWATTSRKIRHPASQVQIATIDFWGVIEWRRTHAQLTSKCLQLQRTIEVLLVRRVLWLAGQSANDNTLWCLVCFDWSIYTFWNVAAANHDTVITKHT